MTVTPFYVAGWSKRNNKFLELFSQWANAGHAHPIKASNFCLLVVLEENDKRNAEQSMETAEIKATVKSLDRERDDLQQQVDEKTEEIMNLEAKKIQLVRLHL